MTEDDDKRLEDMMEYYGTDGIISALMSILMKAGGAASSRTGAKAFIQSSLDDA